MSMNTSLKVLIGFGIVLLLGLASGLILYFFFFYQTNPVTFIYPAGYLDEPSKNEFDRIVTYFKNSPIKLTLQTEKQVKLTSNFLYTITLKVPPKNDLKTYFHSKKRAKTFQRYATVVIIMGRENPPVVREYTVGPLTPGMQMQHSLSKTIDINKRPLSDLEMNTINKFLGNYITNNHPWVFTRYNNYPICTSLDMPKCLAFMFSTPFKLADEPTRNTWYRLGVMGPTIEHNPLDLELRIQCSGLDTTKWSVIEIYFKDKVMPVSHFNSSLMDNMPMSKNIENSFSKQSTSKEEARKIETARLLYPTNRIQVDNNRWVKYGSWEFYATLRTTTGPRLYDIMFNETRIAHEIGLAETMTAYSGLTPMVNRLISIESMFQLGGLSATLIPGIDCPKWAIFLPSDTSLAGVHRVNSRAICLFEWQSGNAIPLSRHTFFDQSENDDYFMIGHGMADRSLVVRSILNIYNYDYIFDTVFHASGDMEVMVSATGNIQTEVSKSTKPPVAYQGNFFEPGDKRDVFSSPLHIHLWSFIVDIDLGPSNKNYFVNYMFQKSNETVPKKNPPFTIERHLLEKEKGFTFEEFNSQPKMSLVCMEDSDISTTMGNTPFLESKCLRIANRAPVEVNFWPDFINASVGWARYPISVTKFNVTEPSSSSMYNGQDLSDPDVRFSDFINSEKIVNEDLVIWITVGAYHLPKLEDIFSTNTVGGARGFHLSPHNLYPVSPDYYSTDRYWATKKYDFHNAALGD